jgi:hypothetical protein
MYHGITRALLKVKAGRWNQSLQDFAIVALSLDHREVAKMFA